MHFLVKTKKPFNVFLHFFFRTGVNERSFKLKMMKIPYIDLPEWIHKRKMRTEVKVTAQDLFSKVFFLVSLLLEKSTYIKIWHSLYFL